MKQCLFLVIFIGLMPIQSEAFFASGNMPLSMWQRIKKNVVQLGSKLNIEFSKVLTNPSTHKALKKYAFHAKKMLSNVGEAMDYGYFGAIALYPFIDRYCMKKAPSWMVSDVSSEFKTFVQDELRAAGVQDTENLYVKSSSLADAHMAVSYSHGLVVSKNLHDVWHELNNLPVKDQKENKSLFKALIDFDSDMIRFIVRREASHIKHKDYLTRTAFVAGLFMFGKWSEYTRNKGEGYSDQSWKKILGNWTTNRLKNIAYIAASLYAYSRFAIGHEVRADVEAASSKAFSQAGAEFFEQMTDVEEVVMGEKLYNFFEKYPALYQMMFLNARSAERAEYLQERVEAFEKSDS